jgi:cysteine-rich repeat protein
MVSESLRAVFRFHRGNRRWLQLITFGGAFLIATTSAHAITWPSDNDWVSIGTCAESEPSGDTSPSDSDLVGSSGFSAALFYIDSTNLYLRQRVATDPAGPGIFSSRSWVVLVQTLGGDPFKYQWMVSLDGGNEVVGLWQNDQATATDISFTPIFSDPAETLVFSDSTTNLARIMVADTSIGGSQNYFVDFAMPVSTLTAWGIDPTTAFYFFATSANANNFNKDFLNCAFSPSTTLQLTKSVSPTTVAPGSSTGVTYTLTVTNSGTFSARGVTISDTDFPSWVTITNVTTTAGTATFTASSFEVQISTLAIGASATITVQATAAPISAGTFTNTATAWGSNAPAVSANATLEASTETHTPTETATSAPSYTPTNIPTQTATPAPTDTATPLPTHTPTETATSAPTGTPTNLPTDTATALPTGTATSTSTATVTGTPTSTPSSTPTDTPTPVPVCGNGIVESGEQCDLGTANCAPGVCCDSSCDADCQIIGRCTGNQACCTTAADCAAGEGCCGNGTVEGDEQCDDGNRIDGDCCSARCQTEPAPCVPLPVACQGLNAVAVLSNPLPKMTLLKDSATPDGLFDRWASRGSFDLPDGLSIDPSTETVHFLLNQNDGTNHSQELYHPILDPTNCGGECFTSRTDIKGIKNAWRYRVAPSSTEIQEAQGWRKGFFRRNRRAPSLFRFKVGGKHATIAEPQLNTGTRRVRQTMIVGEVCITRVVDCQRQRGYLPKYLCRLAHCNNGNIDPREQCGEPGLPTCPAGTTCDTCTCVSNP